MSMRSDNPVDKSAALVRPQPAKPPTPARRKRGRAKPTHVRKGGRAKGWFLRWFGFDVRWWSEGPAH